MYEHIVYSVEALPVSVVTAPTLDAVKRCVGAGHFLYFNLYKEPSFTHMYMYIVLHNAHCLGPALFWKRKKMKNMRLLLSCLI